MVLGDSDTRFRTQAFGIYQQVPEDLKRTRLAFLCSSPVGHRCGRVLRRRESARVCKVSPNRAYILDVGATVSAWGCALSVFALHPQ
jgi:hypothetical protein